MKYLNAAFIFILFSIASFGGGIAQKLAKAAGENSNIEIAFSQRKTMSLFDEVMESKMVFVTDSKGRMRWQVLEPYQSVTIFDGRQVHQFELEAGGWKKLDFTEAENFKKIFTEIRNIIGGKYSETAYDISEAEGKLVITPKDSNVRRVVAKITITPRADFMGPEQIEILSGDGDKTVLTVERATANSANIDDAFDASDILKFNPQN